jgi:hypothetical protein
VSYHRARPLHGRRDPTANDACLRAALARGARAYQAHRRSRGQLGEIAKANPEVAIGSYPFFDLRHGPNTNVVLRAHDAQKLAQAKRAVDDMLGASAASTIKYCLSFALSRRKQGFESPRERQ